VFAGQDNWFGLILVPGANPLQISANWGDGTSSAYPDSIYEQDFFFRHNYPAAGTYTATITVADINGGVSGVQFVTTVLVPPTLVARANPTLALTYDSQQ